MKIPKIIAFTGYAGVGKDTFADAAVRMYGYTKIAFSDPLKTKVEDWIKDSWNLPIDVPEYMVEIASKCRGQFQGQRGKASECLDAYSWVRQKPYSPELRQLVQCVGTEYYRNKDSSYWVKSMHLDPNKHYVITDCRFHDEVDLMLAYGAAIIGIYRDGYGGHDKHVSEANIPNLYKHLMVENKLGEHDKVAEKLNKALAIVSGLAGVVNMEWDG